MAVNEMIETLPPFPEDVPTHPLLVVDYERLKAGDEVEQDTLWKACTTLGYFYLKNHGIDTQPMWELGKITMALPLGEKMKYDQGDSGRSYGYKAAGVNNTDEYGNVDKVEFLNVSTGDALGRPEIINRTYPPCVEERMSAIRTFTEASENVTRTLMDFMSDRLGLPKEILRERHDPPCLAISESRILRSPPMPGDTTEVAIGAHTDFGSLSLLHNISGGLQVLAPGMTSWQYVKPLPGHAICNIGDALSLYTGGVLHSCLHRVVPPPGAQRQYERWSLGYFFRPIPSAILGPLIQSPLVHEAAKKNKLNINEKLTSGEWFTRRMKNVRSSNRTGPETWRAARGTEHIPVAV